MKHLLIDYDSTIPNLALMKISAWAKARGDKVFLNNVDDVDGEPDVVWLSAIFTWNHKRAMDAIGMFHFRYPGAVIHYGGTCFDWGRIGNRIQLPLEIEIMPPDYALYKDDRAVGFCQRGCNRKCGFCDVWKKEGRIADNRYVPLRDWVPATFKKVLLLDNDIALVERWKHDQVLKDAMDMGLKLSITQGYDIRTLALYDDGPERAALLAEKKPYDTKFKERMLYTAWDMKEYEPMVRKGIETLQDAGFKGREITCYVLVGFDHRTKKSRP